MYKGSPIQWIGSLHRLLKIQFSFVLKEQGTIILFIVHSLMASIRLLLLSIVIRCEHYVHHSRGEI